MDQINAITAAARSAQPNTALEGAEISTTGLATGLRDTRDYYNHDIRFIFIAKRDTGEVTDIEMEESGIRRNPFAESVKLSPFPYLGIDVALPVSNRRLCERGQHASLYAGQRMNTAAPHPIGLIFWLTWKRLVGS